MSIRAFDHSWKFENRDTMPLITIRFNAVSNKIPTEAAIWEAVTGMTKRVKITSMKNSRRRSRIFVRLIQHRKKLDSKNIGLIGILASVPRQRNLGHHVLSLEHLQRRFKRLHGTVDIFQFVDSKQSNSKRLKICWLIAGQWNSTRNLNAGCDELFAIF